MRTVQTALLLFISCYILGWSGAKLYYAINDNQEYTIKQEYFSGDFKTYIWHDHNIVKSYKIDPDSLTPEKVKKDSLKAVKLINKLKLIKP